MSELGLEVLETRCTVGKSPVPRGGAGVKATVEESQNNLFFSTSIWRRNLDDHARHMFFVEVFI